MSLKSFQVSWVDLLAAAVLIVGVLRGRSRGMSSELLDLIKWVSIMTLSANIYQPVGHFLAESTVFSLLSCYIAVYAGVIIVVKSVFAILQGTLGQKLVGSDVFGGGEYYLGMLAGAIRYLCMFLVGMSFVHARHFTPEEIIADNKYSQENYGSIRFPSLYGLQQSTFALSWVGRMAEKHLDSMLIEATFPESKGLAGTEKLVRGRERLFNEVLEKK